LRSREFGEGEKHARRMLSDSTEFTTREIRASRRASSRKTGPPPGARDFDRK
jgi:hypothetical protein